LAIIYNLSIRSYRLATKGASLYSNKARQLVDGRKKLLTEIERAISQDPLYLTGKRYWFHCASAGEFEQARPLIEQVKERDPSAKIVVTFFSPSGYNLQKNYKLANFVFYLPFDTPRNVKRFLDSVKPDYAIFIKYEFWYNFLKGINKRGIPLYLVSANFISNQPFFKWWGGFFRKMLTFFTHIYVQDWGSRELLKNIKINAVSVCGDTRFDRVAKRAEERVEIAPLHYFSQKEGSGGRPPITLIAGSTYPKDEEMLLSFFDRFKENALGEVKMVIAPHNVDRESILSLKTLFARHKPLLYSNFNREQLSESEQKRVGEGEIFIIDSVGILSAAYRYGHFAYVGGGFDGGIHNILEPAAYGLPVLFGPKHDRFIEASSLISMGGAFVISNPKGYMEGSVDIFESLALNDKYRAECSRRSLWFIKKNVGAATKILDSILESNSQ